MSLKYYTKRLFMYIIMKRLRFKKYYLSKFFSMNKIDFYTCWEDFQIIQKALQINSSDIILSITSGGCNILNFVLYNPKKILAVDYNPYQNYLLEFKMESIRNLNYSQFLQLMGILPIKNRIELYGVIRKNLNKNTRDFWDLNSYAIKRGLLYVGEQNVKNLGNIFRFLKGKKIFENFFSCETIQEQTDYFYKNIYGLPWRIYNDLAYRNYTVKLLLCLRALHEIPYKRKRSEDYFRYIQRVNYPENHLKKIENTLTKIPIRDNNFASLILLGYYLNENCFPPYLKKENFNKIKKGIDKIEIKTSTVADVLNNLKEDSFTKFNLSNIFDWIDDNIFINQLYEITRVGKNKAKILFSTTRNDRHIPECIKTLSQNKQLAIKLLNEDRTMLYSNLEIAEICK